VTIIGWLEIIIGTVGVALFLFSAEAPRPPGPDGVRLPAYMLFGLACGSVMPFVLLGVFTLKLKPMTRIIHIWCSPLIALIVIMFFWMFVIDSPYHIYFYMDYYAYQIFKKFMWSVFLGILIGTIFYFTRPLVKEQFK